MRMTRSLTERGGDGTVDHGEVMRCTERPDQRDRLEADRVGDAREGVPRRREAAVTEPGRVAVDLLHIIEEAYDQRDRIYSVLYTRRSVD